MTGAQMLKWILPMALLFVGACDKRNGTFGQTSALASDAVPIGPDAPVDMSSALGKSFNTAGTAPLQGFRGFYYDRNMPDRVVYQDTASDIAIKYAWNGFHDIDSPRFGGYWVGRLKFDAPVTQLVSVSLSWSHAKIIINGETVFDGGQSKAFEHKFRAGENLVEVEFENNWHTTEFKLTFQDAKSVNRVDADGLSSILRGSRYQDATVNYVGIYESKARDTSVALTVPSEQKNAILWLSSYEAVEWRVNAESNVPLVVVTSYAPGARVHGIPADRIVYLEGENPIPRISRSDRRCSCTGGYYHCEGDADINEVARQIGSFSSLNLSGYALDYAPADLTITAWSDQQSRAAEVQRQAEDTSRRQCAGPNRPSPTNSAPLPPPSNWRFGDPVTTAR
jgi:hypothetical protein